MNSGYDIIGDIHGHADALHALLKKLGYHKKGLGGYTHPDREAVFVGDFVDRNPQQAETIKTVRGMIDAGFGHAVQANHEFNAISYATQHRNRGDYLRPHNENTARRHAAFLNEFPLGSDRHKDAIAWMKTLPVFLDLGDIFIVHACPNLDSIIHLQPYLNRDNTLTEDAYHDFATGKGSIMHGAINTLLNGPAMKLPKGVTFHDLHGRERDRARVNWWTTPDLPTAERIEPLATRHLSPEQRDSVNRLKIQGLFNLASNTKPSFVGHYWMTGTPAPLSDTAACLDYSVAANGKLTAYRWDGETRLRAEKFEW